VASKQGLSFEVVELSRHTAIKVGGVSKTLGRHNEIDEITARKFWKQFSDVLGQGWWK
jgi:hypothetical protein